MNRFGRLRRATVLAMTAITAGTLAAVAPPTGPAGAALRVHQDTRHSLAPGVSWWRISWTADNRYQRGWVMSVDLSRRSLHIRPGLANGNVNDRETVAKIANQVHALGGINGDLFNWYTWLPWGGVGTAGRVLKTPAKDRPSQFYIRADGKAGIGSLVFTASVRQVSSTGKLGAAHTLSAVNTPGAANFGGLTLFTPEVTGLALNRCAAVSGPISGTMMTVRRLYTEVRHFDRLREGRRLLAACGKAGQWLLAHAPLGQRLRIRQSITTAGGLPVRSFVSGGRLLRLNGKAVADPTGFHTAGINPETGACVSRDRQHVRFIVVDGWMSGLGGGSGVTIGEFGQLAATMDQCYATVVFDGGGSTTMVARRAGTMQVLNQMPREFGQRPVTNGLFVVRD